MRSILILIVFVVSTLSNICYAQMDAKKVEEYLRTQQFDLDPEAGAIVLHEKIDVEMSSFTREYHGRSSTHSTTNYKQTTRFYRIIKIIKRDEVGRGNISLFFPNQDFEHQLADLSGATYNLVDGKVKKTTLLASDVYKTNASKYSYKLSFSLPEVREGSIIEYSYSIETPLHYRLPVWEIQEDIPKLYSSYYVNNTVGAPFHTILQTKAPPVKYGSIDATFASKDTFASAFAQLASGECRFVWVKRNIPALKPEPYVQNPNNFIERMELRMVSSKDWDEYGKITWISDEAKDARSRKLYLADTVAKLTKNAGDKLAKAKAIYDFVRGRIETTENDYTNSDLKNVFNSRQGDHLQKNILLAAMLNEAGLEAYMLYGSTINSISPTSGMPMPDRFTYIACTVVIDSSFIFLDAGDKNNVFGMLPVNCYNGFSWVVSKKGEGVMLTPNLLEDINIRSVKIAMPDNATQEVSYTHKMGIVSSSAFRKELANKKTDLNDYCEKLVAEMAENATITSKTLEYLDKPDANLVLKITYSVKGDFNGDKYFFNPSYLKTIQQNPFRAAKRTLPIEFPYRSSNAFYLNFVLPKGVVIDSIPEPTVLSLEDGKVEYKKSMNYIPEMNTLTANVSFKSTDVVYEKEEYDYFKSFYEDIIKEENKVIELRRKNK